MPSLEFTLVLEQLRPLVKTVVMKAVLMFDMREDLAVRHNELDLQDVEVKYTMPKLIVVLGRSDCKKALIILAKSCQNWLDPPTPLTPILAHMEP